MSILIDDQDGLPDDSICPLSLEIMRTQSAILITFKTSGEKVSVFHSIIESKLMSVCP